MAGLFGLPHRRLEALSDLPDALAAGTGLIEVADRPRSANVELHRQLSTAVADALSGRSEGASITSTRCAP